MKQYEFLLVKSDSLPEVFEKVVYAKELLSNGKAKNVSDAVKKAGISRSAFYKYRQKVFYFDGEENNKIINLGAILTDRAGVFSALTEKLYKKGVNILTINQHHPVDGKASVSLSVRVDNLSISLEQLIRQVREIDGVISIKIL